jgi:hypothetical protein
MLENAKILKCENLRMEEAEKFLNAEMPEF